VISPCCLPAPIHSVDTWQRHRPAEPYKVDGSGQPASGFDCAQDRSARLTLFAYCTLPKLVSEKGLSCKERRVSIGCAMPTSPR
jgi:hypothetical protein